MYRETYSDLVRFLHRKVWDIDRAQDLAQEVFVRALDVDAENPRAWLFTVANNLARDEARAAVRRKKHLVLLKGEAEARAAGHADPHAESVEERERTDAVKRALETLSDTDRTVLLLWDAGLNYGEIAEQSGLKKGAIGTTLSRARRRLVEAYERLEGGHVARG
ncbi:MAG: sigma-70 family RNA polymerase sigma factor [Gemmatimonadota bacterium]|nr:MAG: sigma-70 family RNA polymerase sigma factor [Gemmatimonadota bacterium]